MGAFANLSIALERARVGGEACVLCWCLFALCEHAGVAPTNGSAGGHCETWQCGEGQAYQIGGVEV